MRCRFKEVNLVKIGMRNIHLFLDVNINKHYLVSMFEGLEKKIVKFYSFIVNSTAVLCKQYCCVV